MFHISFFLCRSCSSDQLLSRRAARIFRRGGGGGACGFENFRRFGLPLTAFRAFSWPVDKERNRI